ncbi:MAG: GNAT family N-acetyltransferase [Pseudomonadota bacterium]
MIRWERAADVASSIASIQFQSVREGQSLYSDAQRQAWIAEPHSAQALATRLADAVAVLWDSDRQDVGVLTLSPGGYIDMAFVRPAHQRQGVFRGLFSALEIKARKAGETRLWTHASLMAQPAFQSVGFSVIHHEEIERAGVFLSRAKMEKVLK